MLQPAFIEILLLSHSTIFNKMITRPLTITYPPYYSKYIQLVPETSPTETLLHQMQAVIQLFNSLTQTQLLFKYAPEKWSVKDVLQHIMDCERVFAYRMLRMARFDGTNCAGFEENDYAKNAGADNRNVVEMLDEYKAIRNGSIALIKSLNTQQLDFIGSANNMQITARALVFIMAGHEKHHLNILHERYGI